jgi:hypothetical protein
MAPLSTSPNLPQHESSLDAIEAYAHPRILPVGVRGAGLREESQGARGAQSGSDPCCYSSIDGWRGVAGMQWANPRRSEGSSAHIDVIRPALVTSFPIFGRRSGSAEDPAVEGVLEVTVTPRERERDPSAARYREGSKQSTSTTTPWSDRSPSASSATAAQRLGRSSLGKITDNGAISLWINTVSFQLLQALSR